MLERSLGFDRESDHLAEPHVVDSHAVEVELSSGGRRTLVLEVAARREVDLDVFPDGVVEQQVHRVRGFFRVVQDLRRKLFSDFIDLRLDQSVLSLPAFLAALIDLLLRDFRAPLLRCLLLRVLSVHVEKQSDQRKAAADQPQDDSQRDVAVGLRGL